MHNDNEVEEVEKTVESENSVAPQESGADSRITSKWIIGFWHYGVILTYLAFVFGVVSMVFAGMGKPGIATVLLLGSALCDSFDGAVARTRKNRSEQDRLFGIEIDTLSDLINFGVAPIMIGVALGLTQWYFIVIYVLYVLCTLVRLGNYNVHEIEKMFGNNSHERKVYEGLPCINTVFALPFFYLVTTMLTAVLAAPYGDIAMQCLMAFLYVTCSVLMVLRFRMPLPRNRTMIILACVLISAAAALFCVRWFVVGIHTL